MPKKKHTIRVNAQFDLEVSEEYLEELQKYDFRWAISENCFRNNGMKNITATMEVLNDTREFECFWGDGYRNRFDEKSIMEYHNLDYFNEDRGYTLDNIAEVECLNIGEKADFTYEGTGEHWVRRIK